ncbi:uncharacterized protein MELLADRAFT_61141 [Melampsora larici-populina 98AG31]|uniref:Uncharacterized protein n=1 Tax=Melampsora larici-populina (strain 98AG31 / pathotype 3-4-7) TaxID=747676 RepID=F4RDS2_MELLP|nr:uncharacterized protein MELLADRAFT_61141 [Melampsora larici-populina 98AG31]EGG09449.1 hypothetical protein MELLADRAFT_61141 [Melampsora larici-populina 98AG31]
MFGTTSRGNSEVVLDPDNPSVNKQTMLDWLRINHPMTPISSKAKRAEVANIVREVQPHLFGVRNSPSLASTHPVTYPPLENLQVSSPMAEKPSGGSASLRKRSPPQEAEVPYKQIGNMIVIPPKRSRLDLEAKKHVGADEGSKMLQKKKLAGRPKPSKTKTARPANPNVLIDWTYTPPQSSSHISSISSLSNDDERRELEGLKQLLSTAPLVGQNRPSENRVSPIAPETKPENDLVNTHASNGPSIPNLPISTPKVHVKDTKDPISDEADLIQFSDTEVFEVGNLVIGRDIPAIQFQEANCPNKKTGVDIFQEEQRREERVRTLEERLAQLESTIEVLEKRVSATPIQELQEQANADKIDRQTSLLEQARDDISALERQVDSLQFDTIDLQTKLDIAFDTIHAHRRVLKKILGPDSGIDIEAEYDSDHDNDQSQPNHTNLCTNDHPDI